MPPRRTFPRLERLWLAALPGFFLLLCLRLWVAAFRSSPPPLEGWATIGLILGGTTLGAWNAEAALFASIAAVPLLNGLDRMGLVAIPALPSVIFSSVIAGIALRRSRGRHESQDACGRGAEANRHPTALVADILITIVSISMVAQIIRDQRLTDFWKKLFGQATFGYADPCYFVTSGFVWLQGLFLFRMLMDCAVIECPRLNSRDQVANSSLAAWSGPIFGIYGITITGFSLLQLHFKVPALFVPWPSWVAISSPFEDIHSFGAVTVALFVFAVAAMRWEKSPRTILLGIGAAWLLALVILSWSRATWFSGVGCILALAWLRLPRKWPVVAAAAGVTVVAVIEASAARGWRGANVYLWRLMSLLRIESMAKKDPDRIYLYKKAMGMIRDRPLTGHGIGSFYSLSPSFSRPGDPWANVPNFAHNFLLQLAAELGVPVAALFAGLIGYALWKGIGEWKAGPGHGATELLNDGSGEPWDGRRLAQQSDHRSHLMLGITLALTAYLITQVTANALNIYVSNQFFFWFLMALICQPLRESAETRP